MNKLTIEDKNLPPEEAFKKVCFAIEEVTRSTPDFWAGLRYGWNAGLDYSYKNLEKYSCCGALVGTWHMENCSERSKASAAGLGYSDEATVVISAKPGENA